MTTWRDITLTVDSKAYHSSTAEAELAQAFPHAAFYYDEVTFIPDDEEAWDALAAMLRGASLD